MGKYVAAKVMTLAGPVWCHYSKRNDTTKLRRYINGEIIEFETDAEAIEELLRSMAL